MASKFFVVDILAFCCNEIRLYTYVISTLMICHHTNYRVLTCCYSSGINSKFSAYFLIYISRLCGLVVRVPVYRTEMYCVSYEVRTEFVFVM
jgi:hypothetical protein